MCTLYSCNKIINSQGFIQPHTTVMQFIEESHKIHLKSAVVI